MSRYPFQSGLPDLREAIASWMGKRFGLRLDPYTEILPLMGSKEGIAKLPLAFLDPGDAAVIPDPGYQAYQGGVILAGGEPHLVPLRTENDYLVPLDEIPDDVRSRLGLMYLNYPNNPTAATAPPEYLGHVVDFCRRYDAVLVHDHAYSEIAFDGYRPPSILEVEGADGIALEFHSFSKTYNMTGWRLGYCAGPSAIMETIFLVLQQSSRGPVTFVQDAASAALEGSQETVVAMRQEYERRCSQVCEILDGIPSVSVVVPEGGFFAMLDVRELAMSSDRIRRVLLQEYEVVLVHGAAYGESAEGMLRVSFASGGDNLQQGLRRLRKGLNALATGSSI